MGNYFLLQNIFPTQGLNPSFPHCKQILYHLSHQGSTRILECSSTPHPQLLLMKEVWLLNEGSSDSVAAPQGSTPGETVLMLCCSGQGRESRNQGISLSLLQGIFPTQELNWGLLHCRWILYQLSYPGSPRPTSSQSLINFILVFEMIYSRLRSGEGNGTPLQYSCLENPVDGGAWWAAVHGVAKSRTQLSDFTFTFHFHVLEKEMATHSSILAWRIPGTGEPGGLPSMGSHRVGHD